jgi:hypothetical protein
MAALLVEDRRRSTRWSVLLLVALSPLIIVPLTGMSWGAEDLIASTLLITGAGLAYEASLHLWRGPRQRLVAAGATSAAALLIWAELAVGIFD